MNLNLRQAIIARMQDKTDEQLRQVIDQSIDSEEKALPGLGVLFEVIWQHSELDTQQILVSTLKQQLETMA